MAAQSSLAPFWGLRGGIPAAASRPAHIQEAYGSKPTAQPLRPLRLSHNARSFRTNSIVRRVPAPQPAPAACTRAASAFPDWPTNKILSCRDRRL